MLEIIFVSALLLAGLWLIFIIRPWLNSATPGRPHYRPGAAPPRPARYAGTMVSGPRQPRPAGEAPKQLAP